MSTSMSIRSLSLAAAAAVALLSGCSWTRDYQTVRVDPTYESAANSKFIATNRGAVNALTSGLEAYRASGAPVLVATMVNVNDLRRSAPLGRTLSEQYASAMVANGFNVKEIKLRGDVFVREETGELILSREIKDIAQVHSASLVIVGTYSPATQHTYVSVKAVRTDTGQIVCGHDYALPNDVDVARLLQTPRF